MFELANPFVLLLIFLPLFIKWVCPPAAPTLPVALNVPFFHPLKLKINQQQGSLFNHYKWSFLYLIWILCVLALSGPRFIGKPLPINQEGRNIMMVLDLSGSMALTDMTLRGRPISRLDVVKNAAKQFVNKREGDRLGLILFGSKAYLQTPLTFDRQNIALRIDDATPGLAGQTTSIGDALGLAVKRLQSIPESSKVIILLTDGVNNSGVLTPMKAAELAKSEHIKVYTIGLGSNNEFNNGFFDIPANAELDEKTLQDIAAMTEGRYFRATDQQSLQSIYNKIDTLEPVLQDKIVIRPQKDYYFWILALVYGLMVFFIAQTVSFARRGEPQDVK